MSALSEDEEAVTEKILESKVPPLCCGGIGQRAVLANRQQR
jgi:hypothetical protein